MQGRWLLFVPMYNCAPQIGRTLAQVVPFRAAFAEVFVVDNGSRDGGPVVALQAAAALAPTPLLVVKNDRNIGLGGSHKVAFERCLAQGYDGVIVFHGDDQGRLADLVDAIDRYPDAECVLGARFMKGSSLVGYAAHRIAANVAFNALFSAVSGRVLWDLGSGLNAYRRAFVERHLWEGCADDLTFNYHLVLRTAAAGAPFVFVPISWREEDQVSNAKLVKHGVETLRIVGRFVARKNRFLRGDHSAHAGPRTWTPVTASSGTPVEAA